MENFEEKKRVKRRKNLPSEKSFDPEVLTALDEAISITKEDQAERFLKARLWKFGGFKRRKVSIGHQTI